MSNEVVTRKVYKADDIATILDVSKNKAYRIIKELNNEMRSLGYRAIDGRVDAKFFEHKWFYEKAPEDETTGA